MGVDGSDTAKRATRWAASEADLHGVTLHIVHAWEYPYVLVTTQESQARDLTRIAAANVLDAALELAREVCGAAAPAAAWASLGCSACFGAVTAGACTATAGPPATGATLCTFGAIGAVVANDLPNGVPVTDMTMPTIQIEPIT